MLVISVSEIPPEGLELSAPLSPDSLHVEGEGAFRLRDGGRVEGRLEKGDDDSVHLRGRFAARLELECGRCLVPFELSLDQELDLFYLLQRDAAESEEEVELTDHDVVVAYYRGDRLDVGEALREQIVLALPLKPLCREDCRGLCASCGVNRNQTDCGCAETATPDPRWSALAKLSGRGAS
jgi:uncharacterized protein